MELSVKKSKYLLAASGLEDNPSKSIMSLEGVEAMQYLGAEMDFDPLTVYFDTFSKV